MFRNNNWFRIQATAIAKNPIYENIILIVIIISSLKLVVDTYISDGSPLSNIFTKIDIAINLIFVSECVLKIISKGFILGKKAYLANSWSKLDFFIVTTAIIDMTMSGVDLSILKLFRTLRPLRIISRNPDLKIIISSLVESIGGVLNVIVIILSVFLMFGILGINLLQGKLNYCNASPQLKVNNFGPYGVSQSDC